MIIKAGTYRFNDVLKEPPENLEEINIPFSIPLSPEFVEEYGEEAVVFSGIFFHTSPLTSMLMMDFLLDTYWSDSMGIPSETVYYFGDNSWSESIIWGENQIITVTADTEVDDTSGTWFTENTTMLIKAGTYRWNDELTTLNDFDVDIPFTTIPNSFVVEGTTMSYRFTSMSVSTINLGDIYQGKALSYNGYVSFDGGSEDVASCFVYANSYGFNFFNYYTGVAPVGFGQIITVTEDKYVPTNFGLWANENWEARQVAVIPAGRYRLKLQPTMPDQIIYNGSWELSPEGIYTISEEEGETTKTLLYDANLKIWMNNSARYAYLEDSLEVDYLFAEWFYENIITEPTTYSIFYIKDQIFKFTDGVNWVAWAQSLFADENIGTTTNDYVTYNGYLLSYNNKEVSAYDKIVQSASYGIFPQIAVSVKSSAQVEVNPLFSPYLYNYNFLLPNHTYIVNVKVAENYTLKSCRIENVPYGVSLTADVQDNQIIINVGNIPSNFKEFGVISIYPEFERKIYTPLDTQDVTINGIQTREMLPQYRMDIDGYYYIPYRDHGIKQISASFENTFVFAVSSVYLSLGQGTVEKNSLLNIDEFLKTFGFDSTGAQISERVYITNGWLVEYLNNEIKPSELVGVSIWVADYDLDLFVETYINMLATDTNITYEEALAQVTEQATANNMSVKDYVLTAIQSQLGDLSKIRVYRSAVIAETDVTALTEYVANSNMYSFNALGFVPVSAFYTTSKVLKNSYTFSFMLNNEYDLYKDSSLEQLITGDCVFSSENNFDITSGGNKPDGFYFLTVDSQTLPPDRFTAGVATVSLQTCLSGDTLISMADGTRKRIDQIKVGDIVTTVCGNEKVIFTDAPSHKVRDKYTEYFFSGGTKLTIIKDHRVYSPKHKRYVHISTLINGDKVVLENGNQIELLYKKVYCDKEICHYTIYTENCNGYYANDVLCGNIFANIKPKWARKLILNLYYKLVLRKELKLYDEFN